MQAVMQAALRPAQHSTCVHTHSTAQHMCPYAQQAHGLRPGWQGTAPHISSLLPAHHGHAPRCAHRVGSTPPTSHHITSHHITSHHITSQGRAVKQHWPAGTPGGSVALLAQPVFAGQSAHPDPAKKRIANAITRRSSQVYHRVHDARCAVHNNRRAVGEISTVKPPLLQPVDCGACSLLQCLLQIAEVRDKGISRMHQAKEPEAGDPR